MCRSVEDWDVSKVTSMKGLFQAEGLSNCDIPDISRWDVSSVEIFVSMNIEE